MVRLLHTFGERGRDNTARGQPASPLSKSAHKSITLLRTRIDACPAFLVPFSPIVYLRIEKIVILLHAFEQRGLDNTARVLPSSPLSKIARKSITLLRTRIDACPAFLAPFSPTEFLQIEMIVCLLHTFGQRGLYNTAIGQPSSPLLKSTSKSIAPPHILTAPVRAA